MADPAQPLFPFNYHRHTALFTLLAFAVNVILYALTVIYNQRLDVTRAKQFSLASQSVKLIQALQQPIKVIGFFRLQDPERGQFKDLLKQYRYHSHYMTYEVIDPDRQSAVARRYHITDHHTMVVSGYGREEKVFRLEEKALTRALMKLTRKKKKVVYFTAGHGEASLNDTRRNGYSFVKQRLQDQNYDVKELLLIRHEQLPADTRVVVVAGPRTELVESEISALTTYLENGGHVLIMVDPETASGLTSFLARYGLTLGNDWVIEPNAMGRLFGGDYHMPAVTASTEHPITKDLGGSMTIFPVVRSVRIRKALPDGIRAHVLMSTSPQSWADTDLAGLKNNRSSFDEGRDQKGPISIAVVATMTSKQAAGKDGRPVPAARLIVLGDSEFATNAFITLQGNGNFFFNAINWLAEEEDLLAIQPRVVRGSGPLILTTPRKQLLFWLPVVLLPLTVFACGATFCSRRRDDSGTVIST